MMPDSLAPRAQMIAKALGANRLRRWHLASTDRAQPRRRPLRSAGSIAWIRASCLAAWLRLRPQDSEGWIKALRVACLAIGFALLVGTILFNPSVRNLCNGVLICGVQKGLLFLRGQFSSEGLPQYFGVLLLIGPFFGVVATAITFLPAVNRWLRLWAASRWLDHVIIADASYLGVALAKAYREIRRDVIVLVDAETAVSKELERLGTCLIVGDPHSSETLVRAGIGRATALFSLSGADREAFSLTAAIAEAMANTQRRRASSLYFYLRIGNPVARPLLLQQAEVQFRDKRVAIRLLNRERAVARSLFNRYPLDWGFKPGPFTVHVLIVGCGRVGQAILSHVSRNGIGSDGGTCTVTIVERDPTRLDREVMLNSGLSHHVRLRTFQADAGTASTQEEVAAWFTDFLPVSSVYVCCGDDFLNLSVAVKLRQSIASLGMEAPPFFVDQEESGRPLEALSRLSNMGGDTLRIVPFGLIDDQSDPAYVTQEIDDLLARHIHDLWRLGNAGRPNPNDVDWELLSEEVKESNRGQASQHALVLRALGWHATLLPSPWPKMATGPVLEALARREHERWWREKLADGWSVGSPRDVVRRVHPDVKAYEELDEVKRSYDRNTILQLPGLLQKVGVQLRPDFRLAIWFAAASEPAPALLELTIRSIVERPEMAERHLQLVLPLRVAAEESVVLDLLKRSATMSLSFGVDIALLPYRVGKKRIASELDDASSMVACADRAFCLAPGDHSGASVEAGYVMALAEASDRVLIVAETHAVATALLAELSPELRERCSSLERLP